MKPTILLLGLLLTGCASGGLTARPSVDPATAGELVVIRPSGYMACGTARPLLLDGQKVGTLGCGEYAVLVMPAGEHFIGTELITIWFTSYEVNTAVMITPRQRAFVRMDSAGSFGEPMFNRVTPEAGERLMAETTPLVSR